MDIAKAIGIILVLIGHISRNEIISKVIYSFHMPFFFIISGFLYERRENLKKKIKSILIPYFIFSFISYIYWLLIERNIRGSNGNELSLLLNIFLARAGDENYIFNVVMWFLPCLLMTQLIYFFMDKNIKNNCMKSIIIFFISLIGYALSKIKMFRLPFTLDVVCIALLFYFLGHCLKIVETKLEITKYIKKSTKHSTLFILISIFLFVSVFLLVSINGTTNMNNMEYNSYILSIITACLGSLAIIIISVIIEKNSFLEFVGKNTLVIMCIHEPIKRILIFITSKMLNINQIILRTNIFCIIFLGIILLIICLVITIILNKCISIVKSILIKKLNNK